MTRIETINSKTEWESFLANLSPHTFLQSWAWGEFNKSFGNKIFRLGVFEKNILVGLALVVKVGARRGTFLFCPHGPILISPNTLTTLPSVAPIHRSEVGLNTLIPYLKDLANQEKASFIRISPLETNTQENISLYQDLGFRNAPTHMHAELVWMRNLSPTEEQLLSAMRKTTRYCVKKAQTFGVEVNISSNPSDVNIFYSIYQETVARHDFVPFSLDFLTKEFEAFLQDDQAFLVLGKYNKEVVSGALIIIANGSAFYHHGASSQKYPQIPVSHLTQWEAIKEAKRRGCKYYNFWGIAPENQPSHPWQGLTLFKKGFGGFSEEYVHAQDLVLNKKYWLTYLIEKTRKIKRGL